MTRIFVSHKKRDRQWSVHLTRQLQAAGLEVFVDEDIVRGEGWRQRIDAEVAAADHLLLVASPEAVVSDEVRRELALFSQRRQNDRGEPRRLLVLMRAATPLPDAWNMGQHGGSELTPATYDAEVRAIVKAIAPDAVAKLAARLDNPHWHEAVRLPTNLRQRVLALVAQWLRNDDEGTRTFALEGALRLTVGWNREFASPELLANAALVAWTGDDHAPIQKASEVLQELARLLRKVDAVEFDALLADLKSAPHVSLGSNTPLQRFPRLDPKGSADAAAAKAPRVFISYSRDSDAHTQAVYEFACALRLQGLDARTDHFESFVGDWTSWMVRQVNDCDWVLVVCTERYRHLFEEETTEARGVPFEAVLLRALVYRDNGRNQKCMLVALGAERVEFAPLLLEGAMAFALPRQDDALQRALWGVSDGVMPPIGPPQPVLPRYVQKQASIGRSAASAAPAGRDATPERERLAWLQQELTRVRTAGQDATAIEAELQRTKEQRVSGIGFRYGDKLAGYRLMSRIGKGGFATVWQARGSDGVEVALKLLHHHWTDDRTRVDQFFRGAAQMAALQHPHVVKVIEPRVECDGSCFFTMQRLGTDLGQALPTLDATQRWTVLCDVVAALEFAHANGLVHRDVKPSNILLDADRRGYLADFDLVKAKDTFAMSVGMGDLYYGAPEVLGAIDGSHADARADQYSLALVVLATRDAEIRGHGDKAVEHAMATAKLTRGERAVLARALRVEAVQRFDNVRQMWDRLEAARRDRRAPSLHRRWLALVVGILIVAGACWATRWGQWSAALQRGPGIEDRVQAPIVTPPADRAERKERLQLLGIQLVEVQAGEFRMGSDSTEVSSYDDERPVRSIRIAWPFWLARTEVTNAQYQRFVAAASYTKPRDWGPSFSDQDQPVVGISWDDAKAFCTWAGLRLPSEAEWEYACRAGTTTPFSFGANITPEQVNYDGNFPYAGGKKGNYRKSTVPVGSLPANAWGLHEMHGNVWEWCEDWRGDYRKAPTDGSAQQQDHGSGRRVLRGGSWISHAWICRSAYRHGWPPGIRDDNVGFRPASSAP